MAMEQAIFYGSFIFGWIVFFWDFYLLWRQYCKYRDTVERPKELSEILDVEAFDKSRLYKLDKARFSFVSSLWDQLELTVVLLGGLIPIFWEISGHAARSIGIHNEYAQSGAFMLMGTTLSAILSLPWKMYSTFVIEERHGFNKQTIGFFLKDQVKSLVIGWVIGLPILIGVLWIIDKGGDYFFISVWIFMSVVIFILMTIYPEFIAPLFDKYTPLPDGELRSQIEALAAKLKFPLTKLYIVEGSKRSAHSNAYLYGLWNNKRIVLYDTLVASYSPLNETKTGSEEDKKEDASAANTSETAPKKLGMRDDEVVAVLGHELGHWKLNHTVINLLVTEANMFLCFALFALLYKRQVLYAAFGFPHSQPILIGLLIIFTFIFAPYNEILSFLMTAWTRRMEFAADQFSGELGYSRLLQSALIKLSKDNLTFPVDDWLYSAWHHSHPPVPERIAALKKFD